MLPLNRWWRWSLAVGLVALMLALRPSPGHGWGTLTGGSPLGPDQRKDLALLFSTWGTPGLAPALGERLGAHPIHQLIVYEAWLLLMTDPVMRDGLASFPSAADINGWDGIDLDDRGAIQRAGPGLVADLPELVPALATGPSADAERTAAGWNAEYDARDHYWNPWLQVGEAPAAAGANFSRLAARLIVGRGDAAHAAAYLAHYVSDTLSAKHGDALVLDDADLAALTDIGRRWVAAKADLDAWLASPILDEGVRVIEARARTHPQGDAWLARVARHIGDIGGGPLLTRGGGALMSIAPSSLRTAVACFVNDLQARPADKPLRPFYGYFDPFYFNGPITQSAFGDVDLRLCSALSEHLWWETNPAQAALARSVIAAQAAVAPKDRRPLLTGNARSHYAAWRPEPGFFELARDVAAPAFRATMARLVEGCGARAHGAIDATHDFAADFRPHLDAAIGCVFTAFRASVTALRGEAIGKRVGADLVVSVRVRNVADRPLSLVRARVGWHAGGRHQTRPGWEAVLGDVIAPDGEVTVKLRARDVPDGVALGDLYVDVRGDVADTPDRGWLRVHLTAATTDIVRDPAALEAIASVPTDLVVVFDTTSSMQSSLDALTRETITAIEQLADKTDLRLAVVTFRDLGEADDRSHFQTRPFTSDVAAQIGFLRGLRAGGGGDTPEDQLEGLSRAIGLWEAEGATSRVPVKLVLVVSDAPGKSPDAGGHTFASIAARAEAVDPAHIYPIVVGDDPAALAFAETLAGATGGRVARASGGEVGASLVAAVAAGVDDHAAEARPAAGPELALFGVGALALGAAVAIWIGARRARRRAAALHPPRDHVRTMPAVERVDRAARARRRWVLGLALAGAGLIGLGVGLVVRSDRPAPIILSAGGAPIQDPPLDE